MPQILKMNLGKSFPKGKILPKNCSVFALSPSFLAVVWIPGLGHESLDACGFVVEKGAMTAGAVSDGIEYHAPLFREWGYPLGGRQNPIGYNVSKMMAV
ncbi:hypothetical protein RRF57_011232 [Xylaria bambusicola]|uniref:Uncharacterized protein n=1 Tax=Xylaria bambusicola TaxID=326684 RepID=A0AAN7UMF9_9PEZI